MILDSLKIPVEIVGERRRQDEMWGGERHDDQNSVGDWLMITDHYLARALFATRRPTGDYRENLVKAAATLVAAIESYDRKGSE
jgi:hypothetical protein